MPTWFALGHIRLSVQHFEDGWGWQAWETLTRNGWQGLPPPATDNTQRRFRTPQQAAQFFLLLGDLVSDTESPAASQAAPPGAKPSTPLPRQ